MGERDKRKKEEFNTRIIIKGKGGHSSTPYKTHNPIMIGFELINTMNTRIAYEFSSFDDFILVPVTFDAGIKENIIPEKAEIQYKAIVEDINYVVRIKNLLLTTAKSICELFSAEAEIIFENK